MHDYEIPIPERYCLTINEAAAYFGVGQKRMRKIVIEQLGTDAVIQNGVKYLVKRQKFEEIFSKLTAV